MKVALRVALGVVLFGAVVTTGVDIKRYRGPNRDSYSNKRIQWRASI